MMNFDVISSNIWILAFALLSSPLFSCHQVEPTTLSIDEKHHSIIQHNTAVYEFYLSKVDVTESSSLSTSYYWCVETGLDEVDKNEPSSIEVILSNGKDVRSTRLPLQLYDKRNDRMLLIIKTMSIFCHNGRQTLNDTLRVLVNSRSASINQLNLSLKVTTCTAESQNWIETFLEDKLRFTTDDSISLTRPSLIKEFLPDNLQKFGEENFILLKILAPGSRQCLIATIMNPGCVSSSVRGPK